MRKLILAPLMASSALAVASPAMAEETAQDGAEQAAAPQADATAASDGDIIVIARRRAESLQSVPVSVSAVTGDGLIEKNITNMLDLPRVSPGLTTTPSGGASRNLPLYAIRGQQQGEFLASTDPSVGIYFGETLIQRTYGADLNTFDLQQIEVLKGPQGTLFGRNTTGGNILFRPNEPTFDLGAGFFVETGSYSKANAEAFVNLPLSETVAIRLAAKKTYRKGYIRNTYTGDLARSPLYTGSFERPNGRINNLTFSREPGAQAQRYQDSDGAALRGSIKVDADGFRSLTTGTYLTKDEEGTGYKLLAIKDTGAAIQGFINPTELATINALGNFETRNNAASYSKIKYSWAVSNTMEVDLGDNLLLKNIFGYHKYKAEHFEDMDGSALTLLEYGQTPRGWELSNELQLSGDIGALNFIGGLYFFKEDATNVSITSSAASPFNPSIPQSNGERARNESYSVFLSGTYAVTDALSLTAGGRYTWDKRDIAFANRVRVGLPTEACFFSPTVATFTDYNTRYDAAGCTVSQSEDFRNFTYTLSADYKLAPGKLVYLAHRKGYRSGGFNTRGTVPAQMEPFQPETVRDVEFGFKGDFDLGTDVRLRTNLAAYYQWYSDIQRLVTFTPAGGGTPQTNVLNAASARIYGTEIETNLAVGDWLELYATAALIKPKYKDFVDGGVDVSDTASFGGVSERQLAAGAKFTIPASFADVSLRADWYYQSKFVQQNQTSFLPEEVVPSYDVTNVRLQLADIGGSNFTLGLAVNNVFNQKYIRSKFSLYSQLGFISGYYGEPRTWSADMRFKF